LHHHHNGEGRGSRLIQTLRSLVLKLVFGKVNLNSCCVPIFQSLASTVAEINRRSQIFSDASLAQAPPILVLNVVFGKILPNPSCVPNLKLLASTVAEIAGGPKFFGCSPSPARPPILVLNVVFGKQHPVPKWCINFVAHVHV